MTDKREEGGYIEYKAVFLNGVFVEICDESKEYGAKGPGFEVRIVRSYAGAVATLKRGAYFANVDGTTDDKRHGSTTSWIELYKNRTGASANICAACGVRAGSGWQFQIVGGHCTTANITGPLPVKLPAGSNDVFIIPICNPCNVSRKSDVLTCRADTKILHLTNFMRVVRDAD
jgi:hypothetical protein